MKTMQMCFLTDGIHRNNTPGCLLKLLTDEGHRLGAVLPNFSGEHSPVSISQFRWSADSGHIPTITAHLPLLNHIGHCRFWVLQIARYVP
ncbi:hypothetical protein CDAR_556171 [Caerostris darwini]|uniref:Uncharacterized protein n=1 Tax=Caerostris darwini TaxID=1538125 RepID=A0AAV4SUZ0_9ARAC|nr:hypothetical protein CDAR_556171 [Caerostris darwini]